MSGVANLEEEISLLAQTELFHDLPIAVLRQALCHGDCARRTFVKGALLYTPHAFERSLGIISAGTVQVTKGELIMSVLRHGDLFGAAALFNNAADYATTLTAKSDCAVLFFPQSLISSLMAQYPALAQRYICYLSGRVRFLSDRLDSLAAGSAQQKLGQFLLRNMEGDLADPGCPVTELAGRLGISRASLYRAFEQMELSGAIRREEKTIRVLDISLL
ncbi:hypothetical protein SDC9_45688 [bioreactor metagenome]|uniref:Cyclic nucleotide-binding domain-containing protein n=1 Tax=bioreactor metagenome TaxID=1076179 RepID=A0A644W7L0_9ZZZZ